MSLREDIERGREDLNDETEVWMPWWESVLEAAEKWAAFEWAGRDATMDYSLWWDIENSCLDDCIDSVVSAYRASQEEAK